MSSSPRVWSTRRRCQCRISAWSHLRTLRPGGSCMWTLLIAASASAFSSRRSSRACASRPISSERMQSSSRSPPRSRSCPSSPSTCAAARPRSAAEEARTPRDHLSAGLPSRPPGDSRPARRLRAGAAQAARLCVAIHQARPAALGQLDPGSRTASGVQTRPAMIVVLTDGASNQGVDPLTITPEIVAAKVPVQTIGIGLRDSSATVAGEPVGGVDEATLSAIASATGGKYYYAQAAGELQSIYSTLATQVGWQFQQLNLMVPLLISGISLVLLGAVVSLLWFRVLP